MQKRYLVRKEWCVDTADRARDIFRASRSDCLCVFRSVSEALLDLLSSGCPHAGEFDLVLGEQGPSVWRCGALCTARRRTGAPRSPLAKAASALVGRSTRKSQFHAEIRKALRRNDFGLAAQFGSGANRASLPRHSTCTDRCRRGSRSQAREDARAATSAGMASDLGGVRVETGWTHPWCLGQSSRLVPIILWPRTRRADGKQCHFCPRSPKPLISHSVRVCWSWTRNFCRGAGVSHKTCGHQCIISHRVGLGTAESRSRVPKPSSMEQWQ